MPPRLALLFAALLAAAFHVPLHAALIDTGPMGPAASSAPTPDAALLSTLRLPELGSPGPSTPTAAVDIKKEAARNGRGLSRWLQVQALQARIQAAARKAKAGDTRAALAADELNAILERHRVHSQDDAVALSPRASRKLRNDLNMLEKALPLKALKK